MTGFGRAEQTVNDKTFLVEIKSLNGKQFEMQLRLPPLLRPYEFDIRAILQEQLVRGTIDCMITIKQNGTSKPVNIKYFVFNRLNAGGSRCIAPTPPDAATH